MCAASFLMILSWSAASLAHRIRRSNFLFLKSATSATASITSRWLLSENRVCHIACPIFILCESMRRQNNMWNAA